MDSSEGKERETDESSIEQHSFVVENLEKRIRESGNWSLLKEDDIKRENFTELLNLVPDPDILLSLETYAKNISANIDILLRELRGSLNGIGDLTVESTDCFSDAVSASCDIVDATIKNTYAMLAKVSIFFFRFSTNILLFFIIDINPITVHAALWLIAGLA